MKKILETPRLLLREMTREDYPALCAILQDADTMYAYNGPFSGEEAQTWLDRQLARYQSGGPGLWAVVLKENGAMIGQCGITMQEADGETVPEIGYLLNRRYWHKGYAIEAASACRVYAFETLQLPEIYSIVRDSNIASLNVAIRNGMTIRKRFIKHYRGVDMPHFLLSIRSGG